MLSAYNKEMNSVIKAFKDWKKDADKDAYYLFVVPKFSESALEGFMPLGYSYGFVSKEQLDAHTVAHELGHVREAALLQDAGAAKVQAEQSRLRRESFCPKAYL